MCCVQNKENVCEVDGWAFSDGYVELQAMSCDTSFCEWNDIVTRCYIVNRCSSFVVQLNRSIAGKLEVPMIIDFRLELRVEMLETLRNGTVLAR